MVKVRNMSSPNGNKVSNQFVIENEDCDIFQSYGTIIAKKYFDGSGKVLLDESKWDYSRTTGKYRNIFLGEVKSETLKKIKSGEYILTNLNG